MDVRKQDGTKAELVVGMWYVGMNWLGNVEDTGAGAIAKYVGDNEFYDDGCDQPTRMQDYEYIVESHMGRI